MTNSDFLAEVYGELQPGQFGWVTNFRADPGNAPPAVWSGRLYKGTPQQAAVIDRAEEDNTYFCTAVLHPNEDGEFVRRKDAFDRLVCLVVDDVDPEGISAFSWAMQTSPGKHQVGILLDPEDPDCADRDLVDRVMSALAARGRSNDASGNACVRYVRLPVGSNTKARAAGVWRVQLSTWAPNVRWSLEDACAAVGVDLDGLRMAATIAKSSPANVAGTGTHAGEFIAGITGPMDQRAYHDNLARLAASLVAGGMFPGAAVEFLYSLMDNAKPAGPLEEIQRWEQRRAEIPRAVKSAEKFAPEERKPPEIKINLNLGENPAPPATSGSPGEPVPMDWAALDGTQPEPTHWRLEGWLPERTVTLLSANGGVGKSNLSLQLGVSLATGREFMGLQVKPSRVLVISGEDEARTVHFRVANICDDMGVNLTNLRDSMVVYDLTQADCVLWRAGAATDRMQWLADAVVRHRAEVVILDNASDVFAANENDRAEVRGFMRCLNMICSATGTALLLLAHVDKASVRMGAGQDTNSTFSGSTAWNNSARSRWAMYRDDKAVVVKHEKCNLGPLQDELRLEFDPAAKVFKHYGTVVATQVAATLVRNAQRAAILQLIGRMQADGVNLSMKANAPKNNIYNLLAEEPEFPPRLDRKEFFAIVRDFFDEGLVQQEPYKKANRTTGQRVVLTQAGETRVAIGSGAAPGWKQRQEESDE